ncbi:MAG: hypothetical protein HFJ84_08040 [Clostridiales bacterium]|jgi:hypothetical protein|nr:hypothetical protein [Clostridiales bacterium]
MEKQSIIDMAMGAIKEKVDYEMSKIIDNILDINTKATGKRALTLTISLQPDDERKQIFVNAVAKSKLEPTNPIATALYITGDENGEIAAVEMTPQIPGQTRMNGEEQEEPNVLRLIKNV